MNTDGENKAFRQIMGMICILGGLLALAGLYFIVVPEGNKEPLLLAIGIVLGWGGSVVNSEYGATTTGRKIADAAVNQMNQSPSPVQVVNPPESPVPVQPTEDK